MTREEAIKILEYPVKKWSMEWDEREDGLSYYEALDLAISALRKQDHFRDLTKMEPLTLDELRSAYKLGCPVWLVGMEDGDGWVFIHHVDSCSVRYARIGTSEEWCFRTKSYGVRVWAYRQKPEEDDRGERKENENVRR